MTWLRRLWDYLCGYSEVSYRTSGGVKVDFYDTPTGFGVKVDLDDPETKRVLARQLQKYAQYDVRDGKLVKRGE